MNRTCNVIFFAPTPGALRRGQNVKYHLISTTKSISKLYIPNFLCVLTNERYKTGFSFCNLGHAPGVGRLGAGDAQGVILFFRHGHVEYQKDGDEEENRLQVQFLS